MKKAIVIISVFFLSMSCYAQKFIDPTKVWIIEAKGFSDGHYWPAVTYCYKFIGDTIIENRTYTKMYSSIKQDRSDWKLSSLWREDESEKIFWKYHNTGEELLYNFNLTVGDTIKNSRVPADAIVDSVVVKPFGSVNKKYLYLHLIDVPSHILTWVDGVGSLFNPNVPDDFWVTGGTSKLICFEENGVLVYHNPEYNDCFFTSSANINYPTGEFKVYPNPILGELFVELNSMIDESFTLEMYTAKGERIKSECLQGGSNQHSIDASSLKSGIYILRLISASGKYTEEVIIKE
jgi:hypothetical protein